MKHYLTDDKSRLAVSALKSVLITIYNSAESCSDMYDLQFIKQETSAENT